MRWLASQTQHVPSGHQTCYFHHLFIWFNDLHPFTCSGPKSSNHEVPQALFFKYIRTLTTFLPIPSPPHWPSHRACCPQFSQFSCPVRSNSLQPHGLQHTRLPCPSPTPGSCSNSSPSSWWYHPTISASVAHFSCLQSFSASGSFPISQFFTSGGQSIGVSASASVFQWIFRTYFL